MSLKLAKAMEKISFESVRQKALTGVDEAVEALIEIVQSEEPKSKIAAALALVKILSTVAEFEVTEQLPLLEELQELAKKKLA